jgi:catechol 2,3-dioxygenase-like lactoylglutathione lyase family enzyme
MLLGEHPLAAIWLYCADIGRSVAFYRDLLGLPLLEEHSVAHFDAGGIRVSLHPAPEDALPARGSFLVFLIPDGIDELQDLLAERGIVFDGPPRDESWGRATSFRDPDGHELYLWQPPAQDDPRHESVATLLGHYESVAARRLDAVSRAAGRVDRS